MKLERWFIGLLVAWIASIPFVYVFEEITANKFNSAHQIPSWIQAIFELLETSHLGAPALLVMMAATVVKWCVPFGLAQEMWARG